MHVKLEPSEQLDLPVGLGLITDIESDLFREQLFGDSTLLQSDFSESSSDDDQRQQLPFNFEMFADSVCTDVSSQWEPMSSSSNSPNGSFDQNPSDQAFSEFDFSEFSSDIDVEIGKCTPQDFIVNDIKEESSSSLESGTETSPTSPNHIWDILCSNDIKPNIKLLETPPVTPPESNYHLIESPPTSPSTTGGSPLPLASLQPQRAIITVPVSVKPPDPPTPPRKKIALAPKIPFQVVTTITASGEKNLNSNITRTIKVEPKVTALNGSTVSITSSTGPKFTINKTGFDKCIKVNTKELLCKPVVISGSHISQHSTRIPNTIGIPSTMNVSTCRIIPEHSTTRLPPIAPALNPSLKNSSLSELRALKRQQRMIKNRESASLSRKRKKEYLQGLEDKIRELDTENTRLRVENDKLLRRVTSLENEKVIMRSARFPKRSSTALLGLTFFFLFNMSPVLNLFRGRVSDSFLRESWKVKGSSDSGIEVTDVGTQFQHRTLLEYSSSSEDVEGIQLGDPLASNLSYVCPLNFNSTESLRIDNELRDWFDSSSKDWVAESKKPPSKNRPSSSTVNRLPKGSQEENKADEKKALGAPLTSFIASAAYQYLYHSENDIPSLLPNGFEQEKKLSKGALALGGNLQSLLESIERRNDTYYVVTLTPEHLLLPASAHNTSMRPKMSLLVPTPRTWNGHDQIGLMQIDCEVTHTKVLHWEQRTEKVSMPSGNSYTKTHTNDTHSDSLHKEKSRRRKRKPF